MQSKTLRQALYTAPELSQEHKHSFNIIHTRHYSRILMHIPVTESPKPSDKLECGKPLVTDTLVPKRTGVTNQPTTTAEQGPSEPRLSDFHQSITHAFFSSQLLHAATELNPLSFNQHSKT